MNNGTLSIPDLHELSGEISIATFRPFPTSDKDINSQRISECMKYKHRFKCTDSCLLKIPSEWVTSQRRHMVGQGQVVSSTRDDWLTLEAGYNKSRFMFPSVTEHDALTVLWYLHQPQTNGEQV
jgi:hypothetical protein